MRQVLEFIDESRRGAPAGQRVVLVAHNGASYDFRLLHAECMRTGVTLPSDWLFIDTRWLARVGERRGERGERAKRAGWSEDWGEAWVDQSKVDRQCPSLRASNPFVSGFWSMGITVHSAVAFPSILALVLC